jgi:hypothetical protein
MSRWKRWTLLSASALALSMFLTACSHYYDAWVVNPCAGHLRVETYSSPPERFNRYPPMRSVTVPPASVTKVDHAFTDAGGFSWSVRIVGYNEIVPVNGREWVHDTVILPADACSAAAGSD